MKRILWLLLLVCTLVLPVSAHAVPDLTRQGSITITMRYDGKPLPGGEMVLYRVGSIREDDGNYAFALTALFEISEVSLENVESPETAKKLAAYAKQHSVSGQTQKIDSKGNVVFENLQPGLYLLVQKKAAQGYMCAEPFLVSLPLQTAGHYSYHVDASPKVSPMPEQPPENLEQPKTGQSGWPIWTFAISGAALIMLLRRKRTA